MCTSLTLPVANGRVSPRRLFGRTLDLDTHFGEQITLTREDHPLLFGDAPPLKSHHPILGMAAVEEGYPLYAEAMNDHGLSVAGLRFAEEARYGERAVVGRINLAPWELIPYLLGKYATVEEVRLALTDIHVVGRPFSERLPAAPLHWHIADADPAHGELVVEITADGMAVSENPVGVLTNPPVFSEQLARLAAIETGVTPHGSPLGAGGLGLPGDYTSTSRFLRAALLRRWAMADMEREAREAAESPLSPVCRFFRLLAAVAPPRGAVLTHRGAPHRTLYTCCMDGVAGVYHIITERELGLRTVGFRNGEADVVL